LTPEGWLNAARIVPSPNVDARPPGVFPSLVVIHNISLPPSCFGTGEIEALFTNTLDFDAHPFYKTIRGLRVSSHFLIERDGAVVQFASSLARAWHAGQSCFAGRERCNDFAIGIELEGCDDAPFEGIQYASLARLSTALMERHPIDAFVGHSDISPGRKTDPGPYFDWSAFARTASIPADKLPLASGV
jgi:AmpD protein